MASNSELDKIRTLKHFFLQEVTADVLNGIGDEQFRALNNFIVAYLVGFTELKSLIFRDLGLTLKSGFILNSGTLGVFLLRSGAEDGIVGIFKGTRPTPSSPYESQDITFGAPDATFDRIDIIELEIVEEEDPDFFDTVTFFDQGTEQSFAQNVNTKRVQQVNIFVTAGTPAASPVAPTATAGRMVVAEVTIKTGTSVIDINDVNQIPVDPNLSTWTVAHNTRQWFSILDVLDRTGFLSSLTTTDKSTLVAAINELDAEIGDLSALTTADKSTLVAAINELDGEMGDLSTLTTTDKSTLVAAINELDGDTGDLSDDIGNLATLTTADKSSLVNAVNEVVSEGVLASGLPFRNFVVLTSSQSWPVPAVANKIFIEVSGGGGGGGGALDASGGGSGEIRQGLFSVTPSSSISVTIGSGGAGGSGGTGANGANGGGTIMGSLISLAQGGLGGDGGAVAGVGGSGGFNGSGGNYAGSVPGGIGVGGRGGEGGGNGGGRGSTSGVGGNAIVNSGGGGGGSGDGITDGGDGASGFVKIWY